MSKAIGLFILLLGLWILSGFVYEYFLDDCPELDKQEQSDE